MILYSSNKLVCWCFNSDQFKTSVTNIKSKWINLVLHFCLVSYKKLLKTRMSFKQHTSWTYLAIFYFWTAIRFQGIRLVSNNSFDLLITSETIIVNKWKSTIDKFLKLPLILIITSIKIWIKFFRLFALNFCALRV